MRILQINQCHYRRGGADIVYLNTIDLLKSFGHEVACFSTQHHLNEDSEFSNYFVPNIDLRNSSLVDKIKSIGPYLFNKKAYENLSRLISDFKPDLAHIHIFNSSLSVSVIDALKKNNIPIIHTVHDYRLLCPISSCLDIKKKTCELCVEKSIFSPLKKKCSDGKLSQSSVVMFESYYWKKIKHPENDIDLFHFVSDFCRSKYIKYYPEISNKNVLIYNNSGDSISKNLNLNKLNISGNSYFLFYGRLSIEKGLLTLVEAWETMPVNMKLKIVGRGPLESLIQEKINKKISNNIELLGYKTGSELENIIELAHFVIVPSEWYENNPLTIIESYSLGTPVIGSDSGGIPEIIEEGKTGYIFKTNSVEDLRGTLLKAKDDYGPKYKQMCEGAISYAHNNFSPEKNYYELLNAYKSLIK